MGDKIQMRYHKKTSPVKKIMIVVVLLVMVIAIFFFKFQLKNIEVSDSEYYTKEEITNYVKTDMWDKNTVFFYLKHRFGDQIDIPFVQAIETKYVDSNTIKLVVHYKKIVGCVSYMNENIYFDKDGQVLEISKEAIENIPLYTGISFEKMNLYEPLAVKDNTVFSKIVDISQLLLRHKLTVDKVGFDLNQNVTLYTKDIKVLLGNRTTYDEAIAELTGILPKLEGLKGELDMTEFEPGQKNIPFRKVN